MDDNQLFRNFDNAVQAYLIANGQPNPDGKYTLADAGDGKIFISSWAEAKIPQPSNAMLKAIGLAAVQSRGNIRRLTNVIKNSTLPIASTGQLTTLTPVLPIGVMVLNSDTNSIQVLTAVGWKTLTAT